MKCTFNETSPIEPLYGNDGTIYIGKQNGNIYAIDANCDPIWNSPPPTQSADQNIFGMGLINGELYVTYGHGYIRKHSLSNGVVTGQYQFNGYPDDITITNHFIYDGGSYIYVPVRDLNGGSGKLYKLDLSLKRSLTLKIYTCHHS